MERTLQLRALPETIQQKLVGAAYSNERLAVMRGDKRIVWVVGEDDIRTLRDYDRIEDVSKNASRSGYPMWIIWRTRWRSCRASGRNC